MARRKKRKSDTLEQVVDMICKIMVMLGYIIVFFLAMGAVLCIVALPLVALENLGSVSLVPVFLVVLVALVFFVHRSKRFQRYRAKSRRNRRYYDSLDEATVEGLLRDYSSNPYEFEQYMACVFYDLGYQKVEVTPPVNDRGKDIVMYRDGLKYVVEIKLYAPQNHIGREKIQKLHSAMIDSEADGAIFVTTSDYTDNAVEYAQKFAIETINGDELEDILSRLYDQRQQRAAERWDKCKNAFTSLTNTIKRLFERISQNRD